MDNVLTIDVEDYYMVSAFANVVRFEDWPRFESRVERNTYQLLDLLDAYGVKATFFILGWVAERHPGLIQDVHHRGHEVACHGYNHRLVYDLTPEQFKEDTRRAKGVLEDITGSIVAGYRATSYSIVKRTMWALDVLIDEGFQYDSSIFPVRHDRYGIPGAQRFPYMIERNNGNVLEMPPSTYRMGWLNIPIAGGGYLRLFPLSFTMRAMRKINNEEQHPAIVYLHPWEVDQDQPRIQSCLRSRLRHYINLDTTLPKLKHLLATFRFQPLGALSRTFWEHTTIQAGMHDQALSGRI